MAPDHASRDRVAALGAPSPSVVPPPETPRAGAGDHPDPEFWGAEPRRVRRARPPEATRDRDGPTWAALVDRLRSGRLEVGVAVVAVVVVALVAGVVWYRMGAGARTAPAPRADRPPTSNPAPSDQRASVLPAGATAVTVTTSPAAAAHRGDTVFVHVAGAVVRPGVLLMPDGARVIDAVEGAGGATPDADLDRINLAARLVDGQRILVVRVGAPAVGDPGAVDPAADPGALIDLNSATSAQLESLPGIGPAIAGAIIAERDRRGGFRSVNELREVRGIGEARFADLRLRVTV